MVVKRYKQTDEHRKKISEALKGNKYCLGHKLSQEHKRKISETLKGNPLFAEAMNKLHESNRGNKHTEETKRKTSEALRGRKSPMLGRTQTDEVRRKIGEANKGKYAGEKSRFWKGGISSFTAKIRSSPEYREWRRSALRRDSFTCQMSGPHNGKLHVHHIIPLADNLGLRFYVDNAITLCKKHHDSIKGDTDSFIEYLSIRGE